MKKLFLSLEGSLNNHHAAHAELMARAMAEGHEVYLLSCDAALLSCRYNFTHQPVVCARCEATCQKSADLLELPATRRLRLDRALFPKYLTDELPVDTDALMNFNFEGVNVGRGVASTVISLTRDHIIEPRGKHRQLIALQLRNAIGAMRNYKKMLEEVDPDEVTMFNGRHVHVWPMVELCIQQNRSYITHEKGSLITRVETYTNSLPHSIAERHRLLYLLWDEASRQEAVKAADDYFTGRRRGTNADEAVFTGHQVKGSLPKHFDSEQHNIVIFNSSEDEVKTITEWQTDLYDNQNEAITQITNAFKGRQDVHIYLRIHPNLKSVDNIQTAELREMKQHNLTVIAADAAVDTYELMEAANVVVSFGSMTGIESTFWRTASITYGRSFYEQLDATYLPADRAELIDLLNDKQLPPKPLEGARKFGYYMSQGGQDHRHVITDEHGRGYVNGVCIDATPAEQKTFHLRYLKHYPSWVKQHLMMVGAMPRKRDLKKRTPKALYAKRTY